MQSLPEIVLLAVDATIRSTVELSRGTLDLDALVTAHPALIGTAAGGAGGGIGGGTLGGMSGLGGRGSVQAALASAGSSLALSQQKKNTQNTAIPPQADTSQLRAAMKEIARGINFFSYSYHLFFLLIFISHSLRSFSHLSFLIPSCRPSLLLFPPPVLSSRLSPLIRFSHLSLFSFSPLVPLSSYFLLSSLSSRLSPPISSSHHSPLILSCHSLLSFPSLSSLLFSPMSS